MSYKRSRYSRGYLDPAVATLAREAGKSVFMSKLRGDLDHLTRQGFVTPTGAQEIYDMYQGYSQAKDSDGNLGPRIPTKFSPGRVGGFGKYNLLGAAAGAASAYASGGLPALGSALYHDVARAGHPSVARRPTAYDWVGSGAYSSSNQLVNRSGPSSFVSTHIDETNTIVITHREYLMDLKPASSGFETLHSAYLNPGLSESFPWLSQIAQYFEEYQFSQLLFTVESMVTEGNQNSAGTIVMCTQYNPTNALFNNKAAMENYEHSQSFRVTEHGVHGVECDPSKKGGTPIEYVRTGAVPPNQDAKSYDLGLFQLACQGCYPDLNIGELWVTYTVHLSKAKIPPVGTQPALPILYAYQDYLGGSNTRANFMGATTANNDIKFTYDNSNLEGVAGQGFMIRFNDGPQQTVVKFPVQVTDGKYQIRFSCATAASQYSGPINTGSIGINYGTILNSKGPTCNAAAGTTGVWEFIVDVSAPGNSVCEITFPNNGPWVGAPTGNSARIQINQIFNQLNAFDT